jgi:hypothetical protein
MTTTPHNPSFRMAKDTVAMSREIGSPAFQRVALVVMGATLGLQAFHVGRQLYKDMTRTPPADRDWRTRHQDAARSTPSHQERGR